MGFLLCMFVPLVWSGILPKMYAMSKSSPRILTAQFGLSTRLCECLPRTVGNALPDYGDSYFIGSLDEYLDSGGSCPHLDKFSRSPLRIFEQLLDHAKNSDFEFLFLHRLAVLPEWLPVLARYLKSNVD